ncbi:unnamed protein product [Nesidiocoris tenuis]|uniref:Uncharacterized protein n=1 Tax=Nesidiocoris tenuis TaxID=355587 RepID=A0A6H5H6I9_9HEMI|nr:unnamed protein product [Nesidiocoris tenuis]
MEVVHLSSKLMIFRVYSGIYIIIIYNYTFSSTFGTLTDFYSGIISSALSTEPVKCANLALENNFLFSLNYPLLSCGALRLQFLKTATTWQSMVPILEWRPHYRRTSKYAHIRIFLHSPILSIVRQPGGYS